MSRELLIISWCDLCPPESPQRGMAHTIALDGPPLELDLCESHEVALNLVDIGKALAEHGRTPDGAPPVRRTVTASPGKRLGRKPSEGVERSLLCPFCPTPYSRPYSLIQHVSNHHDMRAADGTQTNSYAALFPSCPLCGEQVGVQIQSHCRRQHGGSIGEVWRMGLAKPERRGPLLAIERHVLNIER